LHDAQSTKYKRIPKSINKPLVSETNTNRNCGVAITEKSMRAPYCDINLISWLCSGRNRAV